MLNKIDVKPFDQLSDENKALLTKFQEQENVRLRSRRQLRFPIIYTFDSSDSTVSRLKLRSFGSHNMELFFKRQKDILSLVENLMRWMIK